MRRKDIILGHSDLLVSDNYWPNEFGPTGDAAKNSGKVEFIRPFTFLVRGYYWPNEFGPTGMTGLAAYFANYYGFWIC